MMEMCTIIIAVSQASASGADGCGKWKMGESMRCQKRDNEKLHGKRIFSQKVTKFSVRQCPGQTGMCVDTP